MHNLTQIFKNLGANTEQAHRLAQGEYIRTGNADIEDFYWDLVNRGYFDHEPTENLSTCFIHITNVAKTTPTLKEDSKVLTRVINFVKRFTTV
jgi:hypothetical protein